MKTSEEIFNYLTENIAGTKEYLDKILDLVINLQEHSAEKDIPNRDKIQLELESKLPINLVEGILNFLAL